MPGRGWWPYKDIATINAALIRLRHRLHLLVAGTPLDEGVLQLWRALPQLRLHTAPGPVSEQALRSVYAADAALVARHPGVGKESGLVMDTAPLGGHLTHRLLHGGPRKIVLARSSIVVASGNHRAPGHKPDLNALACVHHFKWGSGSSGAQGY